ncbi:AMP-binding protein [Legionella gresilensis]|uniref:AMP-binding protein n=1 Tax=Legionella gresilensis TaxID=91823 RepID=UPI0010419E04|nr:AMP-binding protein [Legionella gresilensis]
MPARFIYPTVNDLVELNIKNYPTHLALQDKNCLLDYQEMGEMILKASSFLIDSGIKKGDVIGLVSKNNCTFPILLLAIFKVGGILLSIDSNLPVERKKIMLREAKVRVLLSEKISLIDPKIKEKRKILIWPNKLAKFKESKNKCPIINQQDPAYIFFTSGSTGKPKGVVGSHQSLSHFLLWQATTFAIDPSDRCAQLTRLSFDVVLRSILVPLIRGAALIFPSHPHLASLETLHWLTLEKITFFNSVPTLVKNWLYDLETKLAIPSLRYIFFAGEKLESRLILRFRRFIQSPVCLVNLYGPTETVLAKCFYVIPKKLQFTGVQPIGKPLPDTKITIVNAQGELCLPLEKGEIVIQTPYRSLGYIHEKSTLARKGDFYQKLGTRPYFTGDIGFYDENGLIQIKGRIDDQFKINGVRIEPGEIEFALEEHPAIKQAAIYLEESPTEEIVACLIPDKKKPFNLTKEKLIAFLSTHLPEEMLPKKFKIISQIPLTSSGKLKRKHLPLLPFKLIPQAHSDIKLTGIKKSTLLSSILQKVLNVKSLTLHDSFFDFGLDSLKAARIIYQLNNKLHWNLKVSDLYKHRSLSSLEDYLLKRKCSKKDEKHLASISFNEKRMPLSVQQQQFIFYQSVYPQSPAYHVSYCYQFKTNIDFQKVEKTLQYLIEAHPILTISIDLNKNQFRQKTNLNLHLNLIEINLRKESAYLNLQKFINKPFDLSKAPLFRVLVLKKARKTFLLFVMHHVLIDGISTALFMTKFKEYYGLLNHNLKPKVRQRDNHFFQFICTKKKKLQEKSEINWWKKELTGFHFLELVHDYPKTKATKETLNNGEIAYYSLNKKIKHNISHFSKQHLITEFSILLAVFGILLSRYTRQEDILIGVPFHNRVSQTSDSIGCYVNTLPIRFLYDQKKSFIKICQELHLKLANIAEYQSVSLPALVSELNLSGHLENNPFFEVFFSYEPTSLDSLNLDGNEGKRYRIKDTTAKFELSVIVYPTHDQKLLLEIEFNRYLFNKKTIDDFVKHYLTLLNKLIYAPFKTASQLSFYKTKIKQNDQVTQISYPYNQDIISLIERAVMKRPYQLAIEDMNGQLNYRTLWLHTQLLAKDIRQKVPAGAIIGVLIPRSQNWIIAFLATLSANCIYLPLDPKLPAQRIGIILEDAKPKCLIYDNSLHLEKLKNLKVHKGVVSIYLQRNHIDGTQFFDQRQPNDLNLPAYLLYTSGTTGKPKGVLQTGRTLLNLFYAQFDELLQQKGLHVTQMASSSFDVSLQEITFTLASGGLLYIVPDDYKLQLDQLWQFIINKKINVVFLPPALLQLLAEFSDRYFTSHLRYFITAGESLVITPVIRTLMLKLTNSRIINQFGPTETHVASSYLLSGSPSEWPEYPSIGRPIPNIQFAVLDPYLNFLPSGVMGELYIGGDGLALGYQQAKLTKERFVNLKVGKKLKRFYKTGDLVIQKQDELFYFNGRLDNQLNIHGFRVEPAEIEYQLSLYPGIIRCLVISKENDGNIKLIAYYKTENNQSLSETVLSDFLAKTLPDYMIPTYFLYIEHFPVNINGKIDKGKLPLPKKVDKIIAIENITPRQQEILSICRQIFKSFSGSIEDNLLRMGFDSLKMASLIATLNRRYSVQIPFKVAFEHPYICELGKYIDNLSTSVKTPIIGKKYHKQTFFMMSLQQQRIWNDIKRGQNPVANNLSLALSIQGEINEKAIYLAINSLLKEHDIFYTYLKFVEQEPVLYINSKVMSSCILCDYSQRLLTEEELLILLDDKIHESFYPFSDGLYRAYLNKITSQYYIFLLVIHHLVFDGTSMQLLIKEFSQRYLFFCEKTTENLPNNKFFPYQRFCQYQIHQINMLLHDNINYFKKSLTGIKSLISYPLNSSKLSLYENTKSHQLFEIKDALLTKLKKLAHKYSMTLFTFFTHAYGLLVMNETQKKHVIIGTTVNGRINSDFANTLGLFSQRTILSLNKPNLSLDSLKKTTESIFECLQYQHLSLYDYPNFEALLGDKNIATPQFNIVFQNFSKLSLNIDNLKIKIVDLPNRFYSLDTTDITCVLNEEENIIHGEIVYQSKSFSYGWVESFIKDFIDHLKSILNC